MRRARAAPGARPTLEDVARLAGVSVATASRVLSPGTREPKADLRDRVLAAAGRLRYTPNANARAIARGGTDIAGVIVADISDPYFSEIAAGAMRVADEHGVLTTLADTRRDPRREIAYLSALHGQRARAVILVGSRVRDPEVNAELDRELAAYRAGGGRVAVISQPRLDADTIAIDNRSGARALATELYALGYRRFAVLAGPRDLLTGAERLSGFRSGLAAAGTELFAASARPDCVFAVNDVMAVGVMAAARDCGLDPPGGIGIAGFDDITTLRDVVPALTTVRIPLYDIGAEAMRRVLDPSTTPGVHRIRCEVVIRASTPRRR
jgi:LacI family transcriptional regulator